MVWSVRPPDRISRPKWYGLPYKGADQTTQFGLLRADRVDSTIEQPETHKSKLRPTKLVGPDSNSASGRIACMNSNDSH
jgi:hypothetical protein